VLVLGPPRSGKTSCVIVPSILSAPGPVVSTSTKPDVMDRTAYPRARAGEVMLFDPTGTVERPAHVAPLRWSPISACSDWSEATLVARLMVSASGTSSTGNQRHLDDHWHERAQSLIATLLHAASLEAAPMSTVLRWVDRREADHALNVLYESGSELPTDLLEGIATTDERERSGIWSTASGVLSAYRSDAALATTKGENFDARDFADGLGTIYICASGRRQDLASPLVVALLSEIRTARYEKAALGVNGGPPMLFALDEAANIAPLADLGQQLSEGGGQGLLTLVSLQDMSQARSRWGPGADGWLSLFGAKLVLPGIEDLRTLEMLSTLSGQEEIVTRSVSAPVSTGTDRARTMLARLGGRGRYFGSPPAHNVTSSTIWRPRLSVDEISRGHDRMALLVDERTEMGWVRMTPSFEQPWLSIGGGHDRVAGLGAARRDPGLDRQAGRGPAGIGLGRNP